METTEAILLTALVNIIITGLISRVAIHRITRGIDISFEQRLERFKADLDYSNFQQQRSFIRVYEKRVEILKNLYQKFKDFSDAQIEWVNAVAEAKSNELPTTPLAKGENIVSKRRDFMNYFEANRHDLPDSINRELERIWESTIYWEGFVIKIIVGKHDPENAGGAVYMIHRLAEELEQLYKSEANINLTK